ncbi:hypothetical protein WICMUC_005531 [Wickerhamomyces mucosus]|uniref:Uncharacterized protein n=1 Tax=Wickerhamomyces mucosus TaxID=1378264 RepID=A0A9P8P849_9ASCO|nr:hypothetical protein WICMUC_005531 [Wickerhamomyces mucosus]
MRWGNSKKRNSVSQDPSSRSNNDSLYSKSNHISNPNLSNSSLRSTNEENFDTSRISIDSTITFSGSQVSLNSTLNNNNSNDKEKLISSNSYSTLADNDGNSINKSFNSLKINSSSTNSSSKPFNFDNYDQTILKAGWLNKGSNINNYNHNNQHSWRIYKAELKGPVLSLYKLPTDLNIKSFDPSCNNSQQLSSQSQQDNNNSNNNNNSNTNTVRQRRLSTIPRSNNDNSSPIKQTSSINQEKLISSPSSNSTSSPNSNRIKLKYNSQTYPHPDLQLNSSNSIITGSLEAVCHTILFNTVDDDKLSYNLLLILPLFGDIKTSLKNFLEYSSNFTSQRNKSNGKILISTNLDYTMTQRLGLVCSTIIDSFPGMILDSTIHRLISRLIVSIETHDNHLSHKLKSLFTKKEEFMNQLTQFSTINYDPNGSKDLTNIENFLNISINLLAEQINLIDLKFNKNWNPKTDPSLLYEINQSNYSRLNPLIFNSQTNIHYLGRLIVNHLFGSLECKKSESKRALVITKWIELGSYFDRLGDMVSWLAIATTLCSIPILRLQKTWSLVDEKYIKILSNEWAPVVFELDRRTMISEGSQRNSYHVIAPQGLGTTYPKEHVVPYFGDLTVKFVENSTLKQCEKRVQRVKISFNRWDEYLNQVEQNPSLLESSNKIEQNSIVSQLLNLLSNHVKSEPLTQESVMELSLSIEPNNIEDYSKIHESRTPLITGSYLPTLFSEVLPNYRLFNQNILIGAGGFPTQEPVIDLSNIIDNSSSFQKITGNNDIDIKSLEINSKIPSSKQQHTLLKSVRDIFNIGADVFHVDDDLIFKALSNDNELKKSRPASVVLENPSSKRLSQISNNRLSQQLSNRVSVHFDPNGNGTINLPNIEDFSNSNIEENIVDYDTSKDDEEDDVFGILDNANLLNSLTKPLNVVLKAGTFDRMIDVLVLTSNVFSNKINQTDVEAYLGKTNVLDNRFLKLKMNNGVFTSTFFETYKSFATTAQLLEALSKRFVGSKSAAISISNLNQENTNSINIEWHGQASINDPDINFKYVGYIQIGILEAVSILVSEHYSDFTDDLQNKTLFVDLLRFIDTALVSEWKDILVRYEDSIELKNDLNDIYHVLTSVYKKIRKNFIKKCYRPLDTSPKNLRRLNEEHSLDLNSLKLPSDFRSAEQFVLRLDKFINEIFKSITISDWINVFQLLEIQSFKSLSSLFKFKTQSKDGNHLEILNVFKWLKGLYGNNPEDKIINKFPLQVKILLKLHDNLEKFFKMQIIDLHINREVRTSRMISILQILTISRLRMESVNIFHISPTTSKISPHVPSFIETAITQAIVSPESRLYASSWVYSASALRSEPIKSSNNLIDLLPNFEVDDLLPEYRSGLTPCPGWFIERLLEISNLVPNMSIENSKLINFDKRRFTYNCISNIVDMDSSYGFDSSILESIHKEFAILFNLHEVEESDIHTVEANADRETKEYPTARQVIFKDLIDRESEKIQRDNKKKSILENQERDIKRNQLLSQARSSINLNREMNPPNQQKVELRKGKPTQEPSPSRVSGVGKRIGGLFKSVRPFSINVGSSWSTPDKVIHPDDLPDVSSVDLSGKYHKAQHTVKVFSAKPLFVHTGIEGFFKIVSENSNEELVLQATSNQEAQSWISAFNLAKRYSYLSKDSRGLTSSKVFGVPVSDVCEREGSFLPKIVERLLQEIELRGLDETGLYRIPGSVGSINSLKQAFDEGGDFTLEDDRWFEINTLAGCFKSYLRELPETLFTTELMPSFVEATKGDDLIGNLQNLVHDLPACNYNLLKRLFEHLNKVIQHSEVNRMDAVNLAIVFSMSFVNNDNLGFSMASDLGALQNILQALMKTPESVFFADYKDPSQQQDLSHDDRSIFAI